MLPATVGEWTLDEALLFYGRGGDAIYPASAGSNHPVASFADFLDKPAFSGDRVVCGTDSDSAPTCYIQTGDLGVVLVSDPAALVSVDDLAAFADAFAAQVG
ncbi:hypothetical protein G7085_05385 [Tessaracoccus sp. HDW20]|uniref:hypothetical protein n=1 Tax=Tessaracoccus coleopterorum TaxID=2714950 RepID=UPI0018D3BAB8|nr:hypothetical protein [Tessaracoccus coleopterorum]NHB84248.1 hypothetical protein [Tessaracoccus coleopterorum]